MFKNSKKIICKSLAFLIVMSSLFTDIPKVFSMNNDTIYSDDLDVNTNNFIPSGVIYLAGDSTMSPHSDTPATYTVPRMGWGVSLGSYFNEETTVYNEAISGRSSKSFITEANYEYIMDNIAEGDYFFIQFGHNDAKIEDPLRYTNPALGSDVTPDISPSYKWYLLENYIKPALEKGAHPVLVTSIVRRRFTGGVFQEEASHLDYVNAARELAEEAGIPLIDLYNKTKEYYTQLGEEDTKILHAYSGVGASAAIDNTHLSAYGSRVIAGLFVEEIRASNLPIKDFLKTEEDCNESCDKSLLEAAIVSAETLDESNYTFASWTAFTSTLAYAKLIYQDLCVTQNEINLATNAIISAINALVLNITDTNIPVESLTVAGSSQLSVGSIVTYSATITPANATVQTVTWSVNDSSVAEIDGNGKLTAKKVGTVIITATANNGISGSQTVVIVKNSISSSNSSGSKTSTTVKNKTTLSSYPSSVGEASGWRLESSGWRLLTGQNTYATNEWKLVNNLWYFFNENGYMVTNWVLLNNQWYYLKDNGDMATGWLSYKGNWYFLNSNGVMATGWILVNDMWYYLNISGDMTTGPIIYQGKEYQFNQNGACINPY